MRSVSGVVGAVFPRTPIRQTFPACGASAANDGQLEWKARTRLNARTAFRSISPPERNVQNLKTLRRTPDRVKNEPQGTFAQRNVGFRERQTTGVGRLETIP